MRYIKLFEENKPYREVDLQQLYTDHEKYKDDIHQYDYWFFNKLIQTLLQDKEIEFQRRVDPIDGEISYSERGRVQNIRIGSGDGTNGKNIILRLYDNKDSYILGTVYVSYNFKNGIIVKIYNSEKTEVEEKIEELKIADKYNL